MKKKTEMSILHATFCERKGHKKEIQKRGEKSYFSIKHGEDKPKNNLVGYLQKEGED